jgi:enoyl-CoA hydratase/carnithine racemase
VALAKRAIDSGFDTNQLQGLAIEAQAFHEAFGSQDKVEGVNAFIEKRTPQFSGR